MASGFPHLHLLARVCVTCCTLVGLAIMGQGLPSGLVAPASEPAGSPSPRSVAADALAQDIFLADLALPAISDSRPKEVLPALATPVPATTVVLPTATPEPPLPPQWARVRMETPLRLDPGKEAPAAHFLPRASYLRLLDAGGGRYKVYYGGNGDDLDPAEGWVDGADLDLAPAPRWVEARRSALVWSGPGSDVQLGSLPAGAVVEVLEDLGKRLHVFYLGDGFAQQQVEGWVDVFELGPAGPLIVAEKWGVRVLTRADVQAIEAGEGTWLRVPFRTQLDGSPSADANCGPASVGMVLQFFRVGVPTAELRTVAEKLQGTSDPDLGFSIEFLNGTVDRLGMRGLDLERAPAKLKPWTIEDVRSHLGQGHPVIVELRFKAMPGRSMAGYSEDHYVVLAGVLGDDFIYNDSVDVDGPGYGRLMSTADLERAWQSSYFPFAAFAVSAP